MPFPLFYDLPQATLKGAKRGAASVRLRVTLRLRLEYSRGLPNLTGFSHLGLSFSLSFGVIFICSSAPLGAPPYVSRSPNSGANTFPSLLFPSILSFVNAGANGPNGSQCAKYQYLYHINRSIDQSISIFCECPLIGFLALR